MPLNLIFFATKRMDQEWLVVKLDVEMLKPLCGNPGILKLLSAAKAMANPQPD